MNELNDEIKGLELGAVDYIAKPVRPSILQARIRNHLELKSYRDKLIRERDIIEKVILKMRNTSQFDTKGLRTLMTPVEKTAGDLLLSARRTDGIHHVLLGDFTGHGLTAALGGPMIADIFYEKTEMGIPLPDILDLLNRKMYDSPPTDIFFSNCAMPFDPSNGTICLWNCGMPDIMLYAEGAPPQWIASSHSPFGIMPEAYLSDAETQLMTQKDTLVFAYSDGIIEVQNADGELFGTDRMVDALQQLRTEQRPLEELINILDEFRGDAPQADDITLLELQCYRT